MSADLNKRDRLCIAWLEADSRAGRDVEALEEGLFAVEREGAVRLAKVVVRADLRVQVSSQQNTLERPGEKPRR